MVVSGDMLFHFFHHAKHKQSQRQSNAAQQDLPATKAETKHRDKPERGCGGNPQRTLAALDDGACTDKTDAGEDAQRQTHGIELYEGIGSLAPSADEEVGLQHGHASRETDEQSGSQTCSVTMFIAVNTDERPGEDGQEEAESNSIPAWMDRHDGLPPAGSGF